MRRQSIRWWALLAAWLILTSCAKEMPPSVQEDPDTDIADNSPIAPDEIDHAAFTESEHWLHNSYSRVFRNLPGMIMFTDGGELCYINKRTGRQFSFCYDPLCDGESCIAHANPLAIYYVWSPVDGCLYASQYDLTTAGNDGLLYRLDFSSQEQKMVMMGNGNEIRYLAANKSHIFMLRMQKEGGCEILRYDPIKIVTDIIAPPQGKIFNNLHVSGDIILVWFQDDPYAYLTDSSFSTYEKTELSNIIYMDGAKVYYATDHSGMSVGRLISARNLYQYDLSTKETKHLLSSDNAALDPVGFDGAYVYYLLNPLREDDPRQIAEYGDILHRISVNGGESEALIHFDQEQTGLAYELYAYEACCYDGVICCNVKSETRGTSVDEIWTLSRAADGTWSHHRANENP